MRVKLLASALLGLVLGLGIPAILRFEFRHRANESIASVSSELRKNPANAELRCALASQYEASGQEYAALKQYEQCAELLKTSLEHTRLKVLEIEGRLNKKK